jgi:uncharacterized protein YndB with AHSA1/START domain
MSCNDDERPVERPPVERPAVERDVVLPAPPEEVWESLPAVFGDGGELAPEPGGAVRSDGPDGTRVGVVEEADRPCRLTFWWVPIAGDDAPSHVEIALEPVETGNGVGTVVRVRESLLDTDAVADGLFRGPRALARA